MDVKLETSFSAACRRFAYEHGTDMPEIVGRYQEDLFDIHVPQIIILLSPPEARLT